MGLNIDFPDKTDGMCTNAYLIADLTLDNKTKTGRVELPVWRSKEARDNNLQKINNFAISCGEKEVWFQDVKIKERKYVTSLAFDDFMWKTGDEIYTKLKTLTFLVDGNLIDLSKAVDVKEEEEDNNVIGEK